MKKEHSFQNLKSKEETFYPKIVSAELSIIMNNNNPKNNFEYYENECVVSVEAKIEDDHVKDLSLPYDVFNITILENEDPISERLDQPFGWVETREGDALVALYVDSRTFKQLSMNIALMTEPHTLFALSIPKDAHHFEKAHLPILDFKFILRKTTADYKPIF